MRYRPNYFRGFLEELSDAVIDESLYNLHLKDRELSNFIRSQRRGITAREPLIADPLFEANFSWKTVDRTLAELSGSLLSNRLVSALEGGRNYSFKATQSPYEHQVKAWEILSQEDPQSIVITTGTGSGKTECFMIPILNSIATQIDNGEREELVGVQALFIYPLNALINSQRERLVEWTQKIDDRARFCLFNSSTPEVETERSTKTSTTEVKSRKELRKDPPPILITNITMLEYMLIRAEDQRIINASKGKLKWVVLDEAHSYKGSAAAEIALLLRRVMLAFEVDASSVHFIATSATMGDNDEQSRMELKRFLADIGNIDVDRVHVVSGRREIPALISNLDQARSIGDIVDIDSELEESAERYQALADNPITKLLREAFTSDPSNQNQSLSDLVAETESTASQFPSLNEVVTPQSVLDLLDTMSGTRAPDGQAFLPLRGHFIMKLITGIWSCLNNDCSVLKNQPRPKSWTLGQIYFSDVKGCSCGGKVVPLYRCTECNRAFGVARREKGKLKAFSNINIVDDFSPTAAIEDEDLDDAPDEILQNEGRHTSHIVTISTNCEIIEGTPSDLTTLSLDTGEFGNESDNNGDYKVRIFESKKRKGRDEFECPSCARSSNKRKSLISIATYAPAVMNTAIPKLLEFTPSDKGKNRANGLPFAGRRTLSFNDSRTFTARIAAVMQQTSERTAAKSLIYAILCEERRRKSREQDRNQSDTTVIDALIAAKASDPAHPLYSIYKEELLKVEGSQNFEVSLSFDELRGRIESQGSSLKELKRHLESYAAMAKDGKSDSKFAEFLILREFGNIPRSSLSPFSDNLERLGFVSVEYSNLHTDNEQLEQVRQLLEIEKYAMKQLVSLAIDYNFRRRSGLDISGELTNWMGNKAPKKYLIKSHDERAKESNNRQIRLFGPQNQQLPVLLKTIANEKRNITQSELDDLMRLFEAGVFDAIEPIVNTNDLGLLLRKDELRFSLSTKAWKCPVTGRSIDKVVNGITPFAYLEPDSNSQKALEYEIPVFDNDVASYFEGIDALFERRQNLKSDDRLNGLRELGVWGPIHDKVAEMYPSLIAVEHSAQQKRSRLAEYEREFKEGRINVLNCTTTMEMGIDIGGISTVAMSNIPPHPANYRQRAGRAGRRREGRTISLAISRSSFYQRAVFDNPAWLLNHTIRPVKVKLDSETILQRHMNAYLLSLFFEDLVGIENISLKSLACGSFFIDENGKVSDGSRSLANRYIQFLSRIKEDSSANEAIHSAISTINRGATPLRPTQIIVSSTRLITEIRDGFDREWSNLEASTQDISIQNKKNKEAALASIENLKIRLEKEYLLSFLNTKRYTPSHSFPTNIVYFQYNNDAPKKKSWDHVEGDAETNKRTYNDYPSRSGPMAIREYGPGANVVIDGVVHRSAGITLNWHIPPNVSDIAEVQEIRYSWSCHQCGAAGDSRTVNINDIKCDTCEAKIKKSNCKRFVVPSGYRADAREVVHNDITQYTQATGVLPIFNVPTNYEAMSTSTRFPGRVRVSDKAFIFFYSGTSSHTGFTLCLECGRALTQHYVSSNANHDRLGFEDEPCIVTESSWKLLKDVYLGHIEYTDAVEFDLVNTAGVNITDKSTALTIAVALRIAAAKLQGIAPEELGITSSERTSLDGLKSYTIGLFDLNNGGYSRSISSYGELFKECSEILTCSKECEHGCLSCIGASLPINIDGEDLARGKALAFIDRAFLESFDIEERENENV